MSNNYRLFIGQLVRDVRRRELEDAFGKYGEIVRIDIKNGFGFIEYEHSRDAEEAVRKMDGEEFLGKKIIVEYARGKKRERDDRRDDRRDYRRNNGPERSDYRVVVEGLARGTSWQDLKDAFRSSGEVLFTDVRRDKYDDYYGIVEFRRRDDIDQAIRKMDGAEINGNKIKVKEDRKKKRSRSRSNEKRRKRSGSRDRRRSKSGSRDRSPRKRSSSREVKRKSPSRERSPKRKSESRDRSPKSSERKRSGSRDSGRRSGSRDSKPRDDNNNNNEIERNDNNEGNNDNDNEPRDN